MRLSSILERTTGASIKADSPVTGIAYDSRSVKGGDAFFAIVGTARDGRRYVPDALQKGAAAVVTEEGPIAGVPAGTGLAFVPDARLALSQASDLFFGEPSKSLSVVGITGTKGKTTTCHLAKAVLDRSGEKTSLLGTLHNIIGDEERAVSRTTPESRDIHSMMREMVDVGSTAATMEVSSHAVVLKRVANVRFRVATLTNIGHDHLDFHGSIEAYTAAKRQLFETLPDGAVAVLNSDDPFFEFFRRGCKTPVVTYGFAANAEVTAQDVVMERDRSFFTVVADGRREPVALGLPGRFNIYNALAAAASGIAMGKDLSTIGAGLSSAGPVRGRVEVVEGPGDFSVWVDYAHNPESLENVLHLAREVTKGRLIVVFGCGGDRDAKKRPEMGKIAGDIADYVVITDDNPRSENEDSILDQIETGLRNSANAACFSRNKDRREAIRLAVSLAGPGDLVVVAGKGHETYQEFKDAILDFDDVSVAREAMEDRGNRGNPAGGAWGTRNEAI